MTLEPNLNNNSFSIRNKEEFYFINFHPPPVTKKYEHMANPNTVMAEGILRNPGFFNFNLGISRTLKGIE